MISSLFASPRSGQQLFYLVEPGLRVWEATDLSEREDDKATLTIVSAESTVLLRLLRLLFETLSTHFSSFIRCHVGIISFPGSKVRARIQTKELKRQLPGFGETFLELDETGSVLCLASVLQLPVGEDHLAVLSNARYELLFLAKTSQTMPATICGRYKALAGPLDQVRLTKIVEAFDEGAVARYYEDGCSHCAWQFMGPVEEIDFIESFLRRMAIEKVGIGDVPQQIAAFARFRGQCT